MLYYIREHYYDQHGRKHQINYSQNFANKAAAIQKIREYMTGDQELDCVDPEKHPHVYSEMTTSAYSIVTISPVTYQPILNDNLSILL